jgi:CRISPR-associated endonuclease/helicase Cas3
MNPLTADRFPEFFEALWQHPPFAWQRQLAKRVVDEGRWPEALALPTAAGKTACVDIAVFAMAAGIRLDGDVVRCLAPRRIFFVVDRRIIVDEAHERARQIAMRLDKATEGILREVADVLRMAADGVSQGWQQERPQPLLTFQLRGGMYRSEAWARSPLQPIVVASTVDQVGSRLLFRAYGRGPGMWPILAGLIANDSVIFLDEAHCARPFLETLRAVNRYRSRARSSVATTFFPVVVSATPPGGIADVFRDESAERTDPNHPLGRRQLASKPATVVPPIRAGGKKTPDAFSTALAEQAVALATDDRKAIVIFVNRVATARAVYSILRKHGAMLLTGRMRSFDKNDVITEKLSCLSAHKSESRKLELPQFVVATQTLEVGADLDFDGLVTECASLDALRQRFGRLNRKGRPVRARAAILIREADTEDTEDPVYGAAISRTWTWLCERSAPSNEIDFGIVSLEKHLPSGSALEALNAPAPSAPVMLPAHVDAWAQTSPAPTPAPDVALFLHGRGRTSSDVQVCWRSDLDLSMPDGRDRLLDLLTYCPPTSAECVPVPIARLRRWMVCQDNADDSADIEGAPEPRDTLQEETVTPRSVIRWLNRVEGGDIVSDPSEIKPGDIVIVPADASSPSGLADFAQDRSGCAISDWGDRSFCQAQRRPLLRLHPRLLALWPISESLREEVSALISPGSVNRLEEDSDAFASELRDALRRIGHEAVPTAWSWLPETARRLAEDNAIKSLKNVVPHPFGGLILWSRRRLRDGEGVETFSDEDDSTASGTVAVSLTKHLEGVGDFAQRFARAGGIPECEADALKLAARLHDLGKADPRFQRLLGGGGFPGRELLAKSGDIPQGNAAFIRAIEQAGYPRGGRHELLSVRLAEGAADILPGDDLLRALVLHLIASHHGYCRPFAPVVDDRDPVDVEFKLQGRTWQHNSRTRLERLDSGVADRFWILTRHYGWWGLAWLEAHLRLADHRRSEWEQHHQGESDAL